MRLAEGTLDLAFRTTISARPEEVDRVTRAFADFAAAHALPAPVRRSASVALDEIVSNAVMHGAAADGSGVRVTVEGRLQPDRLVITVRDTSAPFDPFAQATPDTTLSLDDRAIGGLGIHLVRQMMDHVGYARRDDHNEVVLVKLLPTTDGEQTPMENG